MPGSAPPQPPRLLHGQQRIARHLLRSQQPQVLTHK
jgi:hypothetical protein